jgi:serine-type D-Ala-D-Ala carboxypeptidase/endopeptidase (penicillin-binding protein 4)
MAPPWTLGVLILAGYLCGQPVSMAMAQAIPASPPASVCQSALAAKISEIIERPSLRQAHWGVQIQEQSSSKILYRHHVDRLFIPASNAKLLTTAAALVQLGPNYRFQTLVYAASQPPTRGETAKSPLTLRIVGQSDPTFSDADLQALAQQLRRQGVQRIDTLQAEDPSGAFAGFNPTWAWEDLQSGDGVILSPLILNQNTTALQLIPQQVGQPLRLQWSDPSWARYWQVQPQTQTVIPTAAETVEFQANPLQRQLWLQAKLRSGAQPETIFVPIFEPTAYFLQRFRQVLAQHQITVLKTEIVDRPLQPPGIALAKVESAPLSELLAEVNQNSNNLYAEALLAALGNQGVAPDSTFSSTSRFNPDPTAGLAALQTVLNRLGVKADQVVPKDGSGLSRQNLVTPQAIVQVLQAMTAQPTRSIYRQSLGIAGRTGTLETRFQGTPAVGRVYAKSGTLNGITALSGYVMNPAPSDILFSILVNHSNRPAAEIRSAIDEIVLLLVNLQDCQ